MSLVTGILAGALLGGIQASGQAAEASAMSDIEKYNAAVAAGQAGILKAKRDVDVKRMRKQARSLVSLQAASYAKAGVTFAGTPSLVMEDTSAELELDALLVKYNADVEISRSISEAGHRRRLASQYKTSGAIRAGTTLLTTTAQFGAKFIGD